MTDKQSSTGLTADERAAIKERATELRSESKRTTKAERAAAEAKDCLDKIAEMGQPDRAIAEALHQIVAEVAPHLGAKTWYGMPAYADDGKVVVFFKPAGKFKVRYSEVGFNEPAQLDDGAMWPTVFAVLEVTPAVRTKLSTLVGKAAGR